MKANICVIGDVMLDVYVDGVTKRMSPEAPVPVLSDVKRSTKVGGAGNVAMNLLSLNCDVELACRVSNDHNARILEELISQSGIKLSGILCEGIPTTVKTRYLSMGHQLLRCDEEQYFQVDLSDGFIENLLVNRDRLIISDYNKGINYSCQKIIKMCNDRGVKVLVDPKLSDWELYRGADVVTPNLNEFNAISYEHNFDEKSKAHFLMNVHDINVIVITKSENGFTAYGRDGFFYEETATETGVVDVTGAGDTFIATVAKYWPQKVDHQAQVNALQNANIAAGICVQKVGTHAVSEQELENTKVMKNKHNKYFSDWAQFIEVTSSLKHDDVIYTNGCFDVLHAGHVEYLEWCKKQKKVLVVCINSDESIKRIKGPSRPINTLTERVRVLSGLSCVDYILSFSEDTPLELYTRVQPKFIAKGDDYKAQDVVGFDIVTAKKGDVLIAEKIFHTSSSQIIKQMEA